MEALQNSFSSTIDEKNIQINGEKLDADELFLPFLRQPLYPLISVEQNGDKLKITQGDRPFLHNPESELDEAEFDHQYSVVLRWTQTEDEQIIKPNAQVEIDAGSGLIKLNQGQTGYYRVKYDASLRRKLIDQLLSDHTVLDELDRTGLIDDAFNLAIADEIPYSDALDMASYLVDGVKREDSWYVWKDFSARTSYMLQQLGGSQSGDKLIQFFQPAVKAQFERFGFTPNDEESHIEKRMRSTIASMAVTYKVESAVEEAKTLYAAWKANPAMRPHADVAGTVYNLGVSAGDYTDWEFMFEQYKKELVADEKRRYMRAMAGSKNVSTIDYMLNTLAMDQTIILEQDFFTFINYISYSSIGQKMTWDWVRVHWNELVARFGTNDRNFGRMAPNIVDSFNDDYGLWAAEDFFKQTEAGAGEGPRATALSQIRSNIVWMEKYIDDIDGWLNAKIPSED